MTERVHIHLEFETRLSPERVVGTLTDFTERRPELWPNLDPSKYEVHELGHGWAVVTEGSIEPDVWARERYDWGADHVSIRAEASNFCRVGDGVDVKASARPEGGSDVILDWEREARSPEWEPFMAWMKENGQTALLAGYRDVWDAIAESEA